MALPTVTTATQAVAVGATAGQNGPHWDLFLSFVIFYVAFGVALNLTMIWLFQRRWRVAQ
jgi:hypothetical protein